MEVELPPAEVPSDTHGSNLVSCMVCGLVKTFGQFFASGCENCHFLSMKDDRDRTEMCTTASFSGLVSTMEPHKSWASRWLHIDNLAPGCYALAVNEELPTEMQEYLEQDGAPLRIRGDSFYAAAD
eukprot:evm.model.scf_666.2 EVM.evm.TU.scf_666.2   scf_666:8950-10998(-)